MKKIVIPIKIVFAFLALATFMPTEGVYAQTKKAKKTVTHNSKNSLDWSGTYSSGLVSLNLYQDNSYLYQNGNLFNSGTFTWLNGNVILLNGTAEKYKVMEGKLRNEGNSVEFTKNGDAGMGFENAGKVATPQKVLGKWVLVELRGKAIEKIPNEKEPYLIFNNDGTFSGYAGCNGFGGSLKKMDDFKVEFGPAIQTMKACLNRMEVENQMMDAIRTADNYTVSGGYLMLNKAKMAPMAKFKFVEE